MSYVQVISNAVIPSTEGALPFSARIVTGAASLIGGVVNDLRNQSVATQQSCGWFLVVEVAQPADTQTNTTDRSLTLVGGIPTVTWTTRPKTQAELDAGTQNTNQQSLLDKAVTAMANNATYLAIVSPSQAQAVAQVDKLTRQVDAVIKLLYARVFGDPTKLNDTNGT